MKKRMLSIMLLSAMIMALLPVLSASATIGSVTRTVSGSGTLKVTVQAIASGTDDGGSPSWSVVVRTTSGQYLLEQANGGSIGYSYFSLPSGVYNVTVYPSAYTTITTMQAVFE